MRIAPSKFIFRSLIRGYLVNIITKMDVFHQGISETNYVLCWYPKSSPERVPKRHVSLFMTETIATSISN